MKSPLQYIQRWTLLFSLNWQELLTYRATSFVWLLHDALLIGVYPLVWIAVISTGANLALSGHQFITYYFGVFLVGIMTYSYAWYDINQDIKNGTLSYWLVRPIQYFSVRIIESITGRVFRLVLVMPICAVFGAIVYKYLIFPPAERVWWVLLAILMAIPLMHSIDHLMGMVTFWLDDNTSVVPVYYALALAIGGGAVPLDILPAWMRTIAFLLPFRYFESFPVEIWLGLRTQEEIIQGIGILLIWMVLFHLMSKWVWKKGIKRFSAVGL